MELSIAAWLRPVTCTPVSAQSDAEAEDAATSIEQATVTTEKRVFLDRATQCASSAAADSQRRPRIFSRPSLSDPTALDDRS